jgi:hypothetical protein
MRYLPTEDEQEWLLRELGAIFRARGSEQFIQAPIVEPTPEYFPDPVDSLAAGLDRVTRRLLQYAGLGGLDVELRSFRGGQSKTTRRGTHCRRIAGCFLGIEDGCCRFGINVDLPPEIEDLAGVMAHEVAHAYRAYHQLCPDDNEMEELLTDVTTAFLGFGILSVNNSYRFRKSGSLIGAWGWSTSATGYLPPQAHCFLLACQMVARGLEPGFRRGIYRHLETNQAAFLKAAVKHLEEAKAALTVTLGLPPLETLPPARGLEDILTPLKPYTPAEGPPAETEAPGSWNRGRPVFRLRESKMLEVCTFITLLMGALGCVVTFMLFRSWLGLIPFTLVGLALGVRQGRRTRRDVCSDSSCKTVLDPASTECPKCGGTIMGRIAHADERLEMEERIRDATRQR